MRRSSMFVLLAAGLILALPQLAAAAGFSIYEAGSRATALGGAFTATADDGSALFYNPAGISFLSGSNLDVNVFGIAPKMKLSQATTLAGGDYYNETKDKTYLAPGSFFTTNLGDKTAFGLGVYAPFGLGVKWENPASWVGRQVSYDVEIQTIYVTPALSFKLTDNLALAVGADVAIQHLDLHKYTLHPTLGVNALDTEISGTSDPDVTPTFGLMYRPNDKFSFGVMHHMEKTLDYSDQDAVLANAIAPGQAGYEWSSQLLMGLGSADGNVLNQDISAKFKLPSITTAGVSYQFSDRFRAEFDYVYFTWSNFDKLGLDFANDALDQDIEFYYDDSWQIRYGMDYVLQPDKIKLMAGYVYDSTPQPLAAVSPLLPDSDRSDISFGAAIKSGNYDMTLSYMVVLGDERTNIENGRPANPDPAYPVGTYKSVANIFGIGLGYHF